jgi:hypothetical protein
LPFGGRRCAGKGAGIGIEGGLFKRARFREGAHTAHGNHRSKTIYRIIIGVCAFDPRGPLMAHVAPAVACAAPAGVSACSSPTRVPARPPSAGVPAVQYVCYAQPHLLRAHPRVHPLLS